MNDEVSGNRTFQAAGKTFAAIVLAFVAVGCGSSERASSEGDGEAPRDAGVLDAGSEAPDAGQGSGSDGGHGCELGETRRCTITRGDCEAPGTQTCVRDGEFHEWGVCAPLDDGCMDAGTIDAGSVDAGVQDAGRDSGEPDSGTDAGQPPLGEPCPTALAEDPGPRQRSCPGSRTWTEPGSYTFRVPEGCGELTLEAWGAGGGGGGGVRHGLGEQPEGGAGGGGAYVSHQASVPGGVLLTVVVGQGGAAHGCGEPPAGGEPGGGRGGDGSNSDGGGGGGYSGLFEGSAPIAIAAGGGGGAGHGWGSGDWPGFGGAGGTRSGQDGDPAERDSFGCDEQQAQGGTGAQATSGGSAGSGFFVGQDGAERAGGAGADVTGEDGDPGGGGGGGAGRYGGGGGATRWECNGSGGGGGGGSSLGQTREGGSQRRPGNAGAAGEAGWGGRGGTPDHVEGEAGHDGRVTLSWE